MDFSATCAEHYVERRNVCRYSTSMIPSERSIQLKGLTAVGIILIAGGIVLSVYISDMSSSSLMSASPKYKPNLPTVPAVDITQAPQCADGYDKKWVGCQKLAQ